MVPNYIPKRRNKYSREALDNVVREIQEDSISISTASKKHGISKEILRQCAKDMHNPSPVKIGKFTPVLSSSKEKMLYLHQKNLPEGVGHVVLKK